MESSPRQVNNNAAAQVWGWLHNFLKEQSFHLRMGISRRFNIRQSHPEFVDRQAALPMSGDPGRVYGHDEKTNDYQPQTDLRPGRFPKSFCIKLQSVPHRADPSAFHAPAAFRAFDPDPLMYRQGMGTDIRTPFAVDACLLIPFNACRPHHCEQTHQGAVRTQESTPEIFDK